MHNQSSLGLLLSITIPVLSLVLIVAGLFFLDRYKRIRRFTQTGIKSYIASMRVNDLLTSKRPTALRIPGELLIESASLIWCPRKQYARRGVEPITIATREVSNYSTQPIRSLLPAIRLRFNLKADRQLELLITDPRDLATILKTKIKKQTETS